MDKKTCTSCLLEKSITDYYNQKKRKANGESYIYTIPECKECCKKRSAKWQQSIDPERRRAYFRKCDSSPRRKKIKSDYSKLQKENGYYRNYQQNNKDKFKKYAQDRKMNKDHDISEQEWFECLDYFNNCCAYCGISEGEAFELFGQLLHKEHVEHDGANDITNCVPACKGCNSSKWEYDFNEWYNENNHRYTTRRYKKIIKWLMSFSNAQVN